MRALAILLVIVAAASGCSESASFEDEVLEVHVPEGGTLVSSDHTQRGTPRASAIYHYPDVASEHELLNLTQESLITGGWDIKMHEYNETAQLGAPQAPKGFLRAAKGGLLLDAQVGRWTADYQGCCVFTDDRSRPIGLVLTLFDDPSNTK